MFLWAVTMRTRRDARTSGTATFLVHARNDIQAKAAAHAEAHGKAALAHRRGATLRDEGPTVVWLGPALHATDFPVSGALDTD
jgi:hypothetical protein